MDRRMYHDNMGHHHTSAGRNITPCKHGEPDCGDGCGGRVHEDMCERHGHEDMCERDRRDGDFDRFPLAMCYVPWQCFRNIYENEFEALANGTLFKELDLRWYGRSCK